MSRWGNTIAELISPGRVRHQSVPPLEAGLRPNSKLEEAAVLREGVEVDDLVLLPDGDILLSHETSLSRLSDPASPIEAGGPVTALLAWRDGDVIVAVEARGLVRVSPDGQITDVCTDDAVATCVTALAAAEDGTILATRGSSTRSHDDWSGALVHRESHGSLVAVVDGEARVVVGGLAWPSGVADAGDGEVVVSLSQAAALERVRLVDGRRTMFFTNLPAHPGRLSPHSNGWLIAFPYVRNRLSEMLLEERDFVQQMVATIEQDEWMVPRLRNDNPYTSALQLGQLRVLGVLKPWAPARSYGLVAVIDRDGRFTSSMHSRVDGTRHGVTSVIRRDDHLVIAVRGSRTVITIKETEIHDS
jgi:hypothetical protein